MPDIPGVIDLADVRRRADERDAAEKELIEEARLKASQEHFARFDAAMNRAFKGIVSRPERHAGMRRALARQDRQG